MKQYWSHLLFINFEVDQEQLRKVVPDYLELDSYEGKYYSSVVPFEMSHVSFSFTPSLPFSRLNELNLRTYVKYKGVSGIYFFTLDSTHKLANFIARNLFHLPYRYSKIDMKLEGSSYVVKSNMLDLKAEIKGEKLKTDREKFLVERYFLYTDNGKDILRGEVIHRPWDLRSVEIDKLSENLNKAYGLDQNRFVDSFYGKGFDVSFNPFKKIGSIN
jgi:uncharacterized protein YqjF (DUF2071 family)